MTEHLKNKKGFTLIETIISLTLIGILVVIAGFGLTQIVNGYVTAKQNSDTVQKTQLAIAKISRELDTITNISAATGNSITYTRPGPITNTLALSGNTVQINGINMIDNVTTFALTYFDASGNVAATTANIRRIDITLGLSNVGVPFNSSFAVMESYL